MSDQDPVDRLLNQGAEGDKKDYQEGAGADAWTQAGKSVEVQTTLENGLNKGHFWRGKK